jgi:hypothetical protein
VRLAAGNSHVQESTGRITWVVRGKICREGAAAIEWRQGISSKAIAPYAPYSDKGWPTDFELAQRDDLAERVLEHAIRA